jgi:hypothetical protein
MSARAGRAAVAPPQGARTPAPSARRAAGGGKKRGGLSEFLPLPRDFGRGFGAVSGFFLVLEFWRGCV